MGRSRSALGSSRHHDALSFLTEVHDSDTQAVADEEPTTLLPSKCVYSVHDAALPHVEAGEGLSIGLAAPLPPTIPIDQVMKNIKQNLVIGAWSEHARDMWFEDFMSAPSRAVVSDTFWYCIMWYFMPGQHTEREKDFFDRISLNFVALFRSVPPKRKDFFFRGYADAVSQAVLYSLFLAFPKSRIHFTEKFRKDLITRISYWTTGICPEFVNVAHWKLNLGGGDVLQSCPLGSTAPERGPDMHATPLAHRAPRLVRHLHYSPLVSHFLRSRKYSSVNLVRPTRMTTTLAEERGKLMDVKHGMLLDRARGAREFCDSVMSDYGQLCAESLAQQRQGQAEAQRTRKKLEVRQKEVMRSPHKYASYLVSLNILQAVPTG